MLVVWMERGYIQWLLVAIVYCDLPGSLADLASAYLPSRVALFAHNAVATLALFLIQNTSSSSSITLFALAIPSTLMSCPQIFSQTAPPPHSCVSSNAASSEKFSRTMLAKQFPFSNLGSSLSYHLFLFQVTLRNYSFFSLILPFPQPRYKTHESEGFKSYPSYLPLNKLIINMFLLDGCLQARLEQGWEEEAGTQSTLALT